MNTTDPLQLIQKGLHVSLGAVNAVVESLQDTQKRQTNLEQLQRNPSQLAEDLATKGQGLEQSAKGLVENLFNQVPIPTAAQPATQKNTAPQNEPSQVQTELAELAQLLANLRKELEQSRL
jgi:exonuclease VII large subunit